MYALVQKEFPNYMRMNQSFLSDYKRIEGFFHQSKTVKLHLLRSFNKKEINFELISDKNLNLCVFKLSFVVCVVASLPLKYTHNNTCLLIFIKYEFNSFTTSCSVISYSWTWYNKRIYKYRFNHHFVFNISWR